MSNVGSSNVSAFMVGGDGSLSAIAGSPFAGAANAEGVVLTPDGQHLYTAAFSGGTVAGFSVGSTGALTALTGSPFTSGGTQFEAAITPDGRHLYVTDAGGNVRAFSIGTDGSLTAVPGSPFPVTSGAIGVVVAPNGQRLYVANSGRIFGFNIASDGSLTALTGSPFTFAGQNPQDLVIRPDGAFLYASDTTNAKVEAYAVASDGTLSAVGTPQSTGTQPTNIAMTPDGGHVYTANFNGNNVSAFTVAGDGSLTPVGGSPFGAVTQAQGLAASPDSKRLYVASATGSSVTGFNVAADGSLTALVGPPFPTGGTHPAVHSVAFAPDQPPVAVLQFAGQKHFKAFSAANSTDPDGTITRYDWNFGDGQAMTTTTPRVEHTYANNGTFTVTVTETDNEGCSTTFVSTGQTAACNGGPGAAASVQVDTGVVGEKLKAAKTQHETNHKIAIKAKAGAAEAVTVTFGGRVFKAGTPKSRRFHLKPVTTHASAGTLAKVKLKLSKKAARSILAALKSGKRVNANLKAKFVDAAGNHAALTKRGLKLKLAR